MEKTIKNILPVLFIPGAVLAAGLFLGSESFDLREMISSGVAELRLYRMLAAMFIGGALSLSGMVFQAVLRNPLAEPYTLGVSAGAGVGAAACFITGAHALTVYAVPFFALAGAVITLLLVLFISKAGGSEKLLLSGVIAGTICSSVLMFLLSVANSDEVAAASWWLLGDLQSVNERLLFPMIAVTLGLLLYLRWSANELDLLALGEKEAFFLGVNVKHKRLMLVLCASTLAASSVALAGAVGFCGLIVPHAVRRLYGSSHRKNVFPMFIWGAVFLMVCDILSRIILKGQELPVGVVTSITGGPVFLWLLNRKAAR
jgi:iron complex transport system permease protein